MGQGTKIALKLTKENGEVRLKFGCKERNGYLKLCIIQQLKGVDSVNPMWKTRICFFTSFLISDINTINCEVREIDHHGSYDADARQSRE